jgi:hypothetical protein
VLCRQGSHLRAATATGGASQGCRIPCACPRCRRARLPGVAPPAHHLRASRGPARRRGAGLRPFLEGFPRRKDRDSFGWNLDGVPRAGVASGPRLTVAEVETAKTPQVDRLAGLQGVHNGLQALREHRIGLGTSGAARRRPRGRRARPWSCTSPLRAEGASSRAAPWGNSRTGRA